MFFRFDCFCLFVVAVIVFNGLRFYVFFGFKLVLCVFYLLLFLLILMSVLLLFHLFLICIL